jgi:hypothetical protein
MNAATTPIASNSSGTPFPQYNSDLHHRLDGWKEISLYLKRSVRCVQRWERNECLPVYRHKHLHGMTVYAFRYELDAWWQNARQSTASTVRNIAVNSEPPTVQSESLPPEYTNLDFPANHAGAPLRTLGLTSILLVLRQLWHKQLEGYPTRKLGNANK